MSKLVSVISEGTKGGVPCIAAHKPIALPSERGDNAQSPKAHREIEWDWCDETVFDRIVMHDTVGTRMWYEGRSQNRGATKPVNQWHW